MQAKHTEQKVKCIYIDPPYNTDASSILYKNDYKALLVAERSLTTESPNRQLSAC